MPFLGHMGKANTMRYLKKRSSKGQNLLEYTIIVSLISAAVIAMSTYVFRSVQATQKMVEEEFSKH